MNSDETNTRRSDRFSPSEKTISSASSEIIDVQIVEGISEDKTALPDLQPASVDVWAVDEELSNDEPTDPLLQPLPKISEIDTDISVSTTAIDTPPMSSLTQETEQTLNLANSKELNPETSFVEDNWAILLDEIDREPDILPEVAELDNDLEQIAATSIFTKAEIDPLDRETSQLQTDIATLRATRAQLQQEIAETQASLGQIAQTTISDLEQRRQKLLISVEQLERRRDRIQGEINKSFAGSSQEIAIRLQGFKDYLVGSLQDLVTIAEDIEFPEPPPAQIRLETPMDKTSAPVAPSSPTLLQPQFIEPPFKTNAQRVRELLHQYSTAPDYYASPWQLRRTFEPVHRSKVANWFLTQGGRGAVRSLNNRLQNILVASAAISVLRDLYGEYLRTLVLANLPERLGDWRRGLQDCLGISKSDFGGNGGIILFEDPEALVTKADRIIADKEMPLIIIDDSEGLISLSLLEYPLWFAFSPDPQQPIDDYREYR
jgi:Protein of unknown function (DUF3086)